MVFLCCGALNSRKKQHDHFKEELSGIACDRHIKIFSYNELKSATDDFQPSNRIGEGGFGIVYKGILRNGVNVAVKVLSVESKQGVKEFLTEIDIISNASHANLVQLLGCCVEGKNRILVYEYAENNSLDRALLRSNSSPGKLTWDIRSAICIGTARGLAYLHEELQQPIVHRDIKASNILLDGNFNPKIGDFGLARLFPDNVTHISTCVAGTTGYLAPEYALQGQLTKKADVYSYGVLLVEIISGKGSSSLRWLDTGKSLLEWTWELYLENKLNELIDTTLQDYPEELLLRFIKVALFCTQAAANRRPLMSQVVQMLSTTSRLNEKELTAPGLYGGYAKLSQGSRETKLSGKGSMTSISTITFGTSGITVTEISPR